jgi:hypothetical protein
LTRRFVAGAALFHVVVVVLLFAVGRMQLAPQFVDRNGLAPMTDSVGYAQQAALPGAWRGAAAPINVRILSVAFTIFAPWLGYTIVAAEPFNLLCYLLVLLLTFALGREAGGTRAGVVAAAGVALWPSFLFHTAQFLKDPLFIAGALALVLIVVTWLTRTYDWRHALGAGAVLAGAASLLLLIRSKFAVVIMMLVVLGLALLIVRMVAEKRLLAWNLTCAVAALAATMLALAHSTRTFEKVKAYPSAIRGEAKSAAGSRTRMRTIVAPGLNGDPVSLALGSIRHRYIVSDRVSASGVDDQVEIRRASDVIVYLPRAAAIGLWAPFPAMWFQSGQLMGRAGRLVAGAETLVLYVCELLALAAVLLRPRRLPALLLVLFASLGVTILGLVVTNIGTLYRFRYSFWILFFVAGASGAAKLLRHAEARRRSALAVLACATLAIASCARPVRDGLVITNQTGANIDALYLTPADAPNWEENVLGHDILRDGDTVEIRLDSNARPRLWDLRVDSGRYRAEWPRLDRATISRIALRIDRDVAVAEVR